MTASRRFVVAVVLDALVVAAEGAGGVLARSSALLADGAHNLVDVASLLLALGASRLVRRAPTAERSYGLHRATIITALLNAGLTAALTALVVLDAVARLLHPVPVRAVVMLPVALGALAANLAAAAVVHEPGGRDLNRRSARLHLLGDAAGAGAVAVAATAILLTGRGEVLDPLATLVIAALIGRQAWRLGREAVEVLLEATPADIDLPALRAAIMGVPGVTEVHDLHCWSLSGDVRALSAHLLVAGHPTLEQAKSVGERVKAAVADAFAIAHATLELECERCSPDDDPACSIDTAGD